MIAYGWYFWHWLILSFMRISRFGEDSLVSDLLGGGLLAFLVACASYRYVELPIREWRKAGGIKRPGRIVTASVAICFATAIVGGMGSLGGLLTTQSVAASRYGIEGKGALDNGCRILTSSTLPARCLEGKVGIL